MKVLSTQTQSGGKILIQNVKMMKVNYQIRLILAFCSILIRPNPNSQPWRHDHRFGVSGNLERLPRGTRFQNGPINDKGAF